MQFFSACHCEAPVHLKGQGQRYFKSKHFKSTKSVRQACAQCWREGRDGLRGVFCLQGVKLTDQDTRSDSGRGGRIEERLRGGPSVSSAVKLTEWWGWKEGRGGKTGLNSIVPSGRAFHGFHYRKLKVIPISKSFKDCLASAHLPTSSSASTLFRSLYSVVLQGPFAWLTYSWHQTLERPFSALSLSLFLRSFP